MGLWQISEFVTRTTNKSCLKVMGSSLPTVNNGIQSYLFFGDLEIFIRGRGQRKLWQGKGFFDGEL